MTKVKKLTKLQYLANRLNRVREMYVRDGLSPHEIAAALVKAGTITTVDESLESATRLVRSDVARVRAELDADRTADVESAVIGSDVDALERELVWLRRERDRQAAIAGDESNVTTTTVTSGGTIVTEKARWPPGVRQKASKDCALLSQEIRRAEVALMERTSAHKTADSGGGEAVSTDADIFRIVTSGKPIADTIRANAAGGGDDDPIN